MMVHPDDAIEQTSYLRITGNAEFEHSITTDGDYEISFGTVATIALTPDAAERFHRMLGTKMPELRRVTGRVSRP
ncbi:MAG: hypothetical protein HOV94_21060 [Saccharothrix sp.]|nr:hypothetical protein [Saccharothrix sp.]